MRKSQKFSICIIPDQGGRVRAIRLNPTLFSMVIILVLLGGVAIVCGLTIYSYQYYLALNSQYIIPSDELTEIDTLRQNNSVLQSQLKTVTHRVVKLEARMETLKHRKATVDSLLDEVKDQYNMPARTPIAEILPRLSASVAWANNYEGADGSRQLSAILALTAVVGSSRDVVRGLHRDLDRLTAEVSDSRHYWDSLKTNLDQAQPILAATPLFLPLDGRISGTFGNRVSPFSGRSVALHRGVDIPAPSGTQVLSPADGTVISSERTGGYGLMIVVNHGYGLVTRYAHLSDSLVEVGDRIYRGQTIAYSGNSGRSTGPHLHYETILGGVVMDPFRLLPKNVVQNLEFKDGVVALD